MNCVIEEARKKRTEKYITPEDIREAQKSNTAMTVAKDTLEVLGKGTSYGAEDKSVCAFVAYHKL